MRCAKIFILLEWMLLIAATRIVTANERALARKLSGDQPKETRLQTIEAITQLPSKAAVALIPELTRCVNDKESAVRVAAINAIVTIALESELPCPRVFIDSVFHEDAEIRHLSACYVGVFKEIPDEFTPQLLKATNHNDPYVRSHILGPLQKAGGKDERTVPAIRKAMSDSDLQVQLNAAAAYYQATHELSEVLPLWLKLADGHWERLLPDDAPLESRISENSGRVEDIVGTFAAFAVQQRGREDPEDTGKALIKLLGDVTPRLRRTAARAIGLIASDSLKSREALDKLDARRALRKLESDSVKSVRISAENALEGFATEIPPPSKSSEPNSKPPTTTPKQSRK